MKSEAPSQPLSTQGLDPQEKFIHQLYYNPKTGYLSADKLYKKIRHDYPSLKRKHSEMSEEDYPTLAKVRKFIRGQYVEQLVRPPRRPQYYNTIWAPSPGFNYQMDILVYQPTKYETQEGYKYIFIIIDVHSRKVGARPMKRKNEWWPTLFHDIIEKDFGGKYPKHINCDNEFATNAFTAFCEKQNIVLHTSEPNEPYKNAIVERFNRTLALRIQKWRESTGQTDWTQVLPDIIQGYNESWHRTIQAIPQEVWEGKDQNRQTIVATKEGQQFRVGDQVFIVFRDKHPFAKGDRLRHSTSAYLITDQKGHKYQLQNMDTKQVLKRYYKPVELRLVRKGGFDTSTTTTTTSSTPSLESTKETEIVPEKSEPISEEKTEETKTKEEPLVSTAIEPPPLPSPSKVDRTLIKNQRKALKKAHLLRKEDLGHKVVTEQKEGKASFQLHRSLQPRFAKRQSKITQRLKY
jgi:transposase InsO family protein